MVRMAAPVRPQLIVGARGSACLGRGPKPAGAAVLCSGMNPHKTSGQMTGIAM